MLRVTYITRLEYYTEKPWLRCLHLHEGTFAYSYVSFACLKPSCVKPPQQIRSISFSRKRFQLYKDHFYRSKQKHALLDNWHLAKKAWTKMSNRVIGQFQSNRYPILETIQAIYSSSFRQNDFRLNYPTLHIGRKSWIGRNEVTLIIVWLFSMFRAFASDTYCLKLRTCLQTFFSHLRNQP